MCSASLVTLVVNAKSTKTGIGEDEKIDLRKTCEVDIFPADSPPLSLRHEFARLLDASIAIFGDSMELRNDN